MARVMVGNGTATRSNPQDGVEYIGKTGTTDSSTHTWVVGSSTRVATAVWVGNISGAYPIRSYRNTKGIQGGLIRHDIFRPIALAVDANDVYRGGDFPEPSGNLIQGSGVSVPSVVGQSYEAAAATLEAAGFDVTDAGFLDSDVEEGNVVRTEPSAGQLATKNSTVRIYKSNGAAVVVPTLQGDGYRTGDDVKDDLEDAGFENIGADECFVLAPDEETQKRAGLVVGTNPAGGSLANPSEPISVILGQTVCP